MDGAHFGLTTGLGGAVMKRLSAPPGLGLLAAGCTGGHRRRRGGGNGKASGNGKRPGNRPANDPGNNAGQQRQPAPATRRQVDPAAPPSAQVGLPGRRQATPSVAAPCAG